MTLLNARLALAAAAALTLLPVATPALAADPDPKTYHQILADRPVTADTLLDRIQIQDFLTR